MGPGFKIVSYLVTEDNQVGEALFAFAKAIFIFPGYIFAFLVVGNVHSVHFSY